MSISIGSWNLYWASAVAFIASITTFWFHEIQGIVGEPYLDEVFHVRQAQNYLRGRWDIWDPKITTPPGLYLASYLQLKPFLAVGLITPETSTFNLRFINGVGSVLVALLVRSILLLNAEIHNGECEKFHDSNTRCEHGSLKLSVRELVHSMINICLFPPLFFFYGLYYTDVLSVVTVLYAYRCYLSKQETKVIFAGLLSLLFRQTNIFWVSVFLGGMELCRCIPKGRPDIEFPSQPRVRDIIDGSWRHASAYDPPVNQACVEDYMKAGISFAIAGMANLTTVSWSLTSYIVVLCAFGEFVFWNSGVVLGDKENHVASIHLAQILYIWPYFVFFSWPLLYTHLLSTFMQPSTIPSRYPRLSIIFIVTVGMSAIVHFNTMAHPFTLADNRHYMFYIFRILLRFKWVRYCAVPIYLACAWVTLTALGGPPTTSPLSGQESDSMEKTSSKRLSIAPPSSSPGSRPRKRKRTQENSDSTMLRYKAPRQLPTQMPGQHTSFLLVWLLATTLNLVGAPLVEPRYLIIPWLIWRLHMSSPRPEKQIVPPTLQGKPDGVGRNPYDIIKATLDAQHDHRLWLETAWFFVINGVTGYIFLSRGFEWPQEPGQVQRFMW